MKKLLSIMLASALGTAAAPALSCETDLFTVTDWSAEQEDTPPTLVFVGITVDYRYDGDAPLRMLDASVRFDDALGREIGEFPIERDQAIEPGQTVSDAVVVNGERFLRLLNTHRDDIYVTFCTYGVIYDDGAVEEFR